MLKSQDGLRPSQNPRNGDRVADSLSDQKPTAVPSDVYIIDDEIGICAFLSITLEGLGLKTKSFLAGGEAIAALKDHQPRIIFLDIALGKSDAIDVIRALAGLQYSGTIQLMSGRKSSLLDDVHRIGTSHGLNMCPPLEKPFRQDAIRRAVTTRTEKRDRDVGLTLLPVIQPGLDVALANGWLELWYEPKISLQTMRLAGAQAIVRYRHPEHGVHSIDALLPRANSETRAALTAHFLVSALRDGDEFDRAGIHLRTAVDASFGALTTLDIAELVRENRPLSDKWPGLVLEVGEREVIENLNLAHEIATQLQIYDVTLAIQNFGAGFSSLERMRELPFSELNLHAGFVAGCADDTKNAGICEAAINLAHRFKATAVANGIDNASDLNALQEMGCDVGQGSIFGVPMPKSQFVETLRERAREDQTWRVSAGRCWLAD